MVNKKNQELRQYYTIEYQRQYYNINSESIRQKVKQRKLELKAFVDKYKQDKSCNFKDQCLSIIKCENNVNNDPIHDTVSSNNSSRDSSSKPTLNLEFHHKDPNTKFKSVCHMVHQGYSLKRIMQEIEKCVLVCKKCHMENCHS